MGGSIMASIINASTSGAGGVITTADASGVLELQSAGTTVINATTVSGNPRITGDFSNATVASRVSFQNSITNADTFPSILPNGTSVASGINIFNNSDPTNAGIAQFRVSSTEVRLASAITGTGTYQPMTFYNGGAERMRIDSNGNVLVGATSAFDNVSYLNFQSLGGISTKIAGTSLTSQISFFNDNGRIGVITTNGSSTAYNTSSDYRLKEDVAPMVGALDTVAQLKPVTYTWKSDGSDGQGFIAHELQEVVPEAVSGEKDAVNEDGSIKPQGIDTSFLVATLTAAIQEQQAIITDLKARIEVLEGASV
jgi:hypothetical protein